MCICFGSSLIASRQKCIVHFCLVSICFHNQQSTLVNGRKEQMWEKIGTGKKEEAEEKSCIPGTRSWSSKLHWDLSLSEKGGAITYLSHTSLNSHASLIPLTYLSHDSLMTLSYLSHIPLTTLSDTSLIPIQPPLVASSKVCSERTPLLFFYFPDFQPSFAFLVSPDFCLVQIAVGAESAVFTSGILGQTTIINSQDFQIYHFSWSHSVSGQEKERNFWNLILYFHPALPSLWLSLCVV